MLRQDNNGRAGRHVDGIIIDMELKGAVGYSHYQKPFVLQFDGAVTTETIARTGGTRKWSGRVQADTKVSFILVDHRAPA